MRLLIVTPHFYPETFKCNDMAFEMSRRGHEVTVMTAIPDYPQGKYYDGYGVFKKRREVYNGVKIYRSFIIPRGASGKMRLAINYLSYTLFAVFQAIWIGLIKRYDTIVVHETSPIMVGIPAIIIKKIQKIPIHFWILDIWPESLSAAGGVTNGFILDLFSKLTSWIYKNSTTLLISSEGFRQSVIRQGNYEDKIKYFPNWVDELWNNGPCRNEYSIPDINVDRFNVLFAGNIGEAQDMEHVLETASILKDTEIEFILVGDGRKKLWVEKTIKERDLRNVKCLGRFPIETMPLIYEKSSVLFLSLKKEPIFSLTIPAKLQSYMASGKPVVAMIDGEGATLVTESDCGWTVPAGNSSALAELLLSISKKDRNVLNEKGMNGKRYSNKHFDFKTCMDNLEIYISSRY